MDYNRGMKEGTTAIMMMVLVLVLSSIGATLATLHLNDGWQICPQVEMRNECEEESRCVWNTPADKCVAKVDLAAFNSENPYPGPALALDFINSTTGEIAFPNGSCEGDLSVTYTGLCAHFNALPANFSKWKTLTGADDPDVLSGKKTSYCNDAVLAPFIPSYGGLQVNASDGGGYFGVGGYWLAFDDGVLQSDEFNRLFPAVEKLAGLLEFSVTYSLADIAQRLMLAGFLVQDLQSLDLSVGSIACSFSSSIDTKARVFLITGDSAGTVPSGGSSSFSSSFSFFSPEGSFSSILQAASSGRTSIISVFGTFDSSAATGIGGQGILPLLCTRDNCAWSKGLTSLNLNRFPPAMLRGGYDPDSRDAGYGAQLQQVCCSRTCFRDITENQPYTASPFSQYGPPSEPFTCDAEENEVVGLLSDGGLRCPLDQGHENGATYYPYANEIEEGMIFCSTGCNYGIGGCLWPQIEFPNADGNNAPQVPGPGGEQSG